MAAPKQPLASTFCEPVMSSSAACVIAMDAMPSARFVSLQANTTPSGFFRSRTMPYTATPSFANAQVANPSATL